MYGQVRRSRREATSEGVNPTSLAGYGGTSLLSEVACAGNSCSNGIKVNEPSVPNSSGFDDEVIEPTYAVQKWF